MFVHVQMGILTMLVGDADHRPPQALSRRRGRGFERQLHSNARACLPVRGRVAADGARLCGAPDRDGFTRLIARTLTIALPRKRWGPRRR